MSSEFRALGRGGLVVGPHSFGTAALGNLGRRVDVEVALRTLSAAWQKGVRYFDTAPHYGLGLAESRLGVAIASWPRDELILSTKVGRLLEPTDEFPGERDTEGFDVPRTWQRRWDFSRDGVLRSIEASLQRLDTDRIDLVLVHDPDDHVREAMDGAFPALEQLRGEGVISSYGVGMNEPSTPARFVTDTDLDVVMIAGRYTLLDQTALDELLPAAQRRDVSVVAAGVFNSGLLARARVTAGSTYDYEPASTHLLERARRIQAICDDHGVTLPAVAAQFPLGHPAVSTVCIGARTPEQVRDNAALMSQSVPAELWARLKQEGVLRQEAPTPSDAGAKTAT